jgi:hypothetical protein
VGLELSLDFQDTGHACCPFPHARADTSDDRR